MILSIIYEGEYREESSINMRSACNSQLYTEEINCALQGDRGAWANVRDKYNG